VRYRNLLLIVALVAASLAIATPSTRAINIAFRGGDTDHYWDVATAFCKDGVRLSTSEVRHDDGSSGDKLRYAIELTGTSTPLTSQLPRKLAGGSGVADSLASAINAMAYAAPQPIGSAQSVTLERWEHGIDSTEIEDPIGDLSLDDDSATLSGTVANCTVATPPAFASPPGPASGSTLALRPGTPISLPIEASDDDALDLVTLSLATALPAGATLTIAEGANPTRASLSWTPGADQIGSYQITLNATDSTGRAASYSLTLNVARQLFLPAITR
jgi:hypothetical protein